MIKEPATQDQKRVSDLISEQLDFPPVQDVEAYLSKHHEQSMAIKPTPEKMEDNVHSEAEMDTFMENTHEQTASGTIESDATDAYVVDVEEHIKVAIEQPYSLPQTIPEAAKLDRKSLAPLLISAGFCGVMVGIGTLGWFSYTLKSDNQALHEVVSKLQGQISTTEPLFIETNNRVDSLNSKVKQLNAEIAQLMQQNKLLLANTHSNDMEKPTNSAVALEQQISSPTLTTDGSAGLSIPAITPPDSQAVLKTPPTIAPPSESKNLPKQDSPMSKPILKAPKKDGKWVVNLVSFRSNNRAETLQKKFEAKSIPVEKHRIDVGGKPMYRLRVTGFQSKRDADKFGTRTIKKLSLDSYWLTL